jgi:hypothetical protein
MRKIACQQTTKFIPIRRGYLPAKSHIANRLLTVTYGKVRNVHRFNSVS